MTDEEIKDYITLTHTYLTANDMAEDLVLSITQIGYYCKKLNLQPVKVKQRNIDFILKNHKTMSAAKIGKMLGMSERNVVENYGKELGICFIKEEEKVEEKTGEPTKKSARGPGSIMSNFRMGSAGHYYPPKADKEDITEKLRELFRHEKKKDQ